MPPTPSAVTMALTFTLKHTESMKLTPMIHTPTRTTLMKMLLVGSSEPRFRMRRSSPTAMREITSVISRMATTPSAVVIQSV